MQYPKEFEIYWSGVPEGFDKKSCFAGWMLAQKQILVDVENWIHTKHKDDTYNDLIRYLCKKATDNLK